MVRKIIFFLEISKTARNIVGNEIKNQNTPSNKKKKKHTSWGKAVLLNIFPLNSFKVASKILKFSEC